MKEPMKKRIMKLKNKYQGEKGGVTLFVLIAMLFFLMVGIIILFSNFNAGTSQKKDIEKIKNEYNSSISDSELDQVYAKEKEKLAGNLLISVTNNKGEIYQNNTWLNGTQVDLLPLTVNVTWPEGLSNLDKKLELTRINYTDGASNPQETRIEIKENTIYLNGQTSPLLVYKVGEINKINDDCDFKIKATANGQTAELEIKVDISNPVVNVQTTGDGIIWQLPGEERTGRIDATITANDKWTQNGENNLDKVQYIVNQTIGTPAANADWQDYTGEISKELSAGEGEYYVHARAIDKAGNTTYVDDSTPYAVKNANYEVTTGTTVDYAETLAEAVQKASTTDVSTIKPLKDLTDNSTATINKNITLDTNGKTITMAETITVSANKTATFEDTAETKGKLQRTTGDLITNNGNVVVNDLTMSSNKYVINGGNNVTVNSGNLNSSDNAVIIASYITVNSGNIISQGRYGIISRANCDIKGGKVEGATLGVCPSNGTLKISGTAEIKGGVRGIGSDAPSHSYTLEMTGGTVIGTAYHGIYSTSKNTNITITGGTITGGINSIHIEGENNTVTITGGTITGGTNGIRTTGANSTVTIGDNTNALDRETPVIQGTTNYGVNMTGATSTFNFYDGKLIGGKHDKTYSGRDVTFSVANDTTVTPLTGHKPYTRENATTHKFETVLEKQVNVTFNPNPNGNEGATVAESNRNVLTNVEYKEKAETAEIANLPTPTRTGYTFKGWNGKNKLAKSFEYTADASTITLDDMFYLKAGTYKLSYDIDNATSWRRIIVMKNSNGENLSGSTYAPYTGSYFNSNRNAWLDGTNNTSKSATITIAEDCYVRILIGLGDTTSSTTVTNAQLEEGNTATAYEPYYVTDDTLVTQEVDHTLNAIWEENEYTVHFNGDGSTAGTVEDQKFKYNEEKALNENKFERKYTVTYDGNEGTTAKANDTATYTFANWINKTNNLTYQDKAVVKNLTSEPNGEVTLYAVWTPHEVTLPTATREGYIFNGWYDATTGGNKIGNAGDKYIPEADTRLYAQWRQVHYTILVGEENLVAETLEEAIKLAEDRITGSVTTATITALMNYTDNSTATVSKNITIDLAGKTITLTNILTNNGTLEIKSIQENGKINRNGNVIINNRNTSSLTVSSGAITSTSGYGINNNANGNVTVAGGNVSSQSSIGIKNSSVGIINISGGSISGTHGVYNEINGTINVSNGTITATTGHGIRGYIGKVNVTGGTINGKTYGISVTQYDNNSGSLVIRGGSVISEGFGLYAGHGSSITIGDNDSTVSKETPMIESTATSGDYYGVSRESDATFNFYDGKIIGYDKHSLNRDVSNKPDKYKVFKRTIDGKEIAVLEKEVKVTFNKNAEDATCTETERNVLTNVEYQYNATTGENQTLPIPTRTGYTFQGWNGKNLFDESKYTRLEDYDSYNNRYYWATIQLKQNTTYKVSVKRYNNYDGKTGCLILAKVKSPGQDGYWTAISHISSPDTSNSNFQYTTSEDGKIYIGYYNCTQADLNTIWANTDVQIEEGTTVTPYEPYYITDNTKVVQEFTHTLKAKWEPISYTVTADANGGTIASTEGWTGTGNTATKSVTYDSEYGTLPTVTKKGYTLKGWNGKNLFNVENVVQNYYIKRSDGQPVEWNDVNTPWNCSDYIEIEGGKTYTFNPNSTAGNYDTGHALYDENKNFISSVATGQQTITTPANARYIRVSYRRSNSSDIQLEEGDTATQYEPYYLETTTPVTTAKNHTIKAIWEVNQYTLTLNPNGGTWNGQTTATTVTQNYNTTYNVANNPTREGYIFTGWRLVENGQNKNIEADGNIKYFDESNNSQILKQYKITGTNSPKPAIYNYKSGTVTHTIVADDSSSTGYSLEIKTNGQAGPDAGGFINSNSSVAGTFYYHKLVAKVPSGYSLNIYSNQTGFNGSKYWLTDNTGTGEWKTYIYVQYTGYNQPFSTFGHVTVHGADDTNVTWNLQESTVYKIANNLTELQATNVNYTFIDSNQTLTAAWIKNGSRVTFDNQGGTFANGWTSTYTDCQYDTVYANTRKAPYYISDSLYRIYKTGYTLDGWYTQPNGQGTKLFDANGQLIPSVPGYTDANVKWLYYTNSFTIYAKWVANQYTVTADANGGTIASTEGWTGTGASATKSVTCESTYETLPTVLRAGYTFKGWNGKNLLNLQVPESTPSDTASNNTTKRTFEYNTYVKSLAYNNYYNNYVSNIITDANSVSFKTSSSYGIGFPLEVNVGSDYVLSYNAATNNSNAVVGILYYAADGTLINRLEISGNGYKNQTFKTPDNIKYLVIALCAGGRNTEVTFSNVMLEEGSTATTYEPYYLSTTTPVTTLKNHTLKAIWQANPYFATLEANGGTVAVPSMPVLYDSPYGELPTPMKDGFEFVGWYKEDTFQNKVEADTIVTTASNHTLYAKWGIGAGLYDENDNLIKSWSELEALGVTKEAIETDYTYNSFRSNTGSLYNLFKNNNLSGKLVLPNTITKIGDYALITDNGLTSIIIPEGVTSIGEYAFFDYFTSGTLRSVTIPASVRSIDNQAFYGCSGLTSINVDSNNSKYDSRNNCNAIIETSSNALMVGCNNTVIPDTVTSIRQYAFYGCSGLTSITIPASVRSINNQAFYGCSGLTSINVDSNNSRYDSRNNCNAIISISTNTLITGCKNTVIPDTVRSIGQYAFYGCSGLTSITIPNNVTSIGQYAFYRCSGLTSIIIPNSVTTIPYNAFAYCESLTSVTIPNSVTSIGQYAFYGCSGLTSITIPNNVTSIGKYAFCWCSGLTSITMPNSITSIEESVFSGCISLTSITIPDSVTSIGRQAFYECSNLANVTFNNPNGWFVSTSSTATSGTNLTLTSTAQNATYLKSTYRNYYWKRNP